MKEKHIRENMTMFTQLNTPPLVPRSLALARVRNVNFVRNYLLKHLSRGK